MRGIQQFHTLLLFLALFSFNTVRAADPQGECSAPTQSHLYCTNVTYNSIKIYCTVIPGAYYYQFQYRPVGTQQWYTAPVVNYNYWNMTGLNSGTNYEYKCKIFCSGGWTAYSPVQYCTTMYQSNGANCNNAVLLQCGITYNGSNNSNSYNYSNYSFPNGTQVNNMTGPESYHKFTITSTSNVTITLGGLSQNLHLFLLNNCNSNCNITGCMQYSCNSGKTTEQMTVTNLAPGTYIIIVDGWQGAYCNYNLTVNCCAVVNCTAAVSSQIYTSNQTSNSVQLNTSAPGYYYDWAYRPVGGSWINLPATSSNYYNLTGLQPGVVYEFIVAIYCGYSWSNWSPGHTWNCPNNNNGPGTSCSKAIPVECGKSYSGNNGQGGYNYSYYTYNGQTNYEWGPEVVYAVTLTDTSSLTVNLTGLSNDLDLFLLNSCTGNSSVIAQSGNSYSNNESITVNNLPAGTYYIVVDGWNGCISNYLLSVMCSNNNPGGGTNPTNDEPCNAYTLQPNTSCLWTNGNNTGATMTTNPGGCYSPGMKDVWYKVQIPATGKMKISTGAGSMTNGVIGIYGGSSCSYLKCYGCFDNTGNSYMPEITVTGSPGTFVYIRVWGYNGSVGSFTICVTILNNSYSIEKAPGETVSFDMEAVSAERSEVEESLTETPASIRLFPVPAQNQLNLAIELPADEEAQVSLMDLNGRLVQEVRTLRGTEGVLLEQLDVSELPAGLYLVKLRTGERELTGKFSKL